MENKIIPGYIKAVYVLILIALIIFALIIGRNILLPLVLSAYIAMLLTPFCNWMERIRIPRAVSSLIALLTSLIFIAGLIFFLITQLGSFGDDFEDIGEKFNTYLVQIDSLVTETTGIETGLDQGIDQKMILEMIQGNSGNISRFLLGTAGSLTSVILLPVFIFFLLMYRTRITIFIMKLYANHHEEEIKAKIISLRAVIQSYISGIFKVMVILAVLNSTALLIIGVDHAIFFGCLAAFLNIIPYVGPFIAALLPVFYALVTMEGLFSPIAIVVSFIFIQTLEGNIFTPKIVGKNVNLNPLITIIGLLVGASIWGPMGMILIIPTLAILSKIFHFNEETKPYAYLFGDED